MGYRLQGIGYRVQGNLLRVSVILARARAGAAAVPIVGNNPVRPPAMERLDLRLVLLHRCHGTVYEKDGPLRGFRV